MPLVPFHLAFPVHDLAVARAFYGDLLGCPEGRSDPGWVDFDLAGHQIVAHLAPDACSPAPTGSVDGDAVPVRHFGLVLPMADWERLAERLRAQGVAFVIEPHLRFVGHAGEQATMSCSTPPAMPSSSRPSPIRRACSRAMTRWLDEPALRVPSTGLDAGTRPPETPMNILPDAPRWSRRRWLRAASALAAGGGAVRSSAQGSLPAYPSRPVQVVIQYPVGGPSDSLARLVFVRLQERLRQPFVVEARAGAGGTLATQAVVKSPADGYTLLMSASGPLAMSPWLVKALGYDPLKELAPVVHVASVPLVLVVNGTVQARTASQFLADLRSAPGKFSYGSSGNGTPQHLSAALLESMAGFSALHVPYRGQAPMATDLIGGQVNFALDSLIQAQASIASGRLRALAVTSRTRSPLLPEVPTLEEVGLKGYESLAWYGVLAPAATPLPVVELLNRESRAVLDLPEVRDQVARLGSPAVHGTREQFGAFIRAEHAKWGELIRRYRITLD